MRADSDEDVQAEHLKPLLAALNERITNRQCSLASHTINREMQNRRLE